MECDSAEKSKTRKQPTTPAEVYLPGRSRELDEDEELVMDKAAYRLYYQLHVEAPSLSFDILLDCLGENRPVEPTGWSVSKAYHGHEGSVEDIQWSPTEATVFLSASTDRSLRVWDTRSPAVKNAAMITLPEAHQSDVNVISWSRIQPVSVVSGADDGCIRVWDLRMVSQQCKSGGDRVTAFTHSFDYHRAAITSVEWHPNEAGIFVATSEDDQTTLWDITLEQEVPAAAAAADMDTDEGGTDATNDTSEVPVQLLFIHTGQHEVKEAHWHPQIPGLVINTAADGFNVFRTICV
nr:unnamed protein product [Spirometra erinaceieuropaei]